MTPPAQDGDQLLREARVIIELVEVLSVARGQRCLDRAWSTAALTDREPEHALCLQVTAEHAPHRRRRRWRSPRFARPAADMSS